MKRYKVVMHFNKFGATQGKPWTVHFRETCYLVSKIECHNPMASEWKPSKKNNPRAFFVTSATTVFITKDDVAVIFNK